MAWGRARRWGPCRARPIREASLTDVLIILALAGCGYAVLASVAVLWARRRAAASRLGEREPPAWPGITVLKPLHGDEPCLYANLETVLRQDYPGAVEVIFGVGDSADPATETVKALQRAYPDRAIRLVVDARRWGQNGKVSNLANMAEHVSHEIVVLADSDISVGADYLRRLVAALGKPGIGAVTCLYRGIGLPNPWSRLAVQWIDYHFLPSVLVGTALRLARPCFGSTIALRRETLERIGGFRAFADRLADDYAIGEAVRDLGLDVVLAPDLMLGHLCPAVAPAGILRQELRWMRTIRSVDPVGFLGFSLLNPIPVATAVALLSGPSLRVAAVLGLAVASRLLLQLLIVGFVKSERPSLILGPVRDYAAFLVFILSFWPGSIDWRGHRFALRPDGTLVSPDLTGS